MSELLKFADVVKQMRLAQKEYFRTRSSKAMENAKKLEKQVDQMVDEVGVPARSSKGFLFK